MKFFWLHWPWQQWYYVWQTKMFLWSNGICTIHGKVKSWDLQLTHLWHAYALWHHRSPMMTSHQSLDWHHNECNGISNHRHLDCLLNRLFKCRSKKTSKLFVTGLCEEVTSEFPTQRASNTENVSIWWCHHDWGRHLNASRWQCSFHQ